ncbi:unnamed protein product [Meloidogyne enterolobii]|uniref:Uncharacterized protein n=1 Tax=Meloidogyne enterolobii TaxID=390850 RepID=A0ACB0YQA3_MELEN
MALICSCEVLHVSGHSIFFVIAVTGKNFVPLLAANLLMIPSIFALCTCMALMLSAAVDRLFAVGAPQKHTKICIVHKYLYLGIHTFACITLGLFNVYYATKYSIENPNIPTTGCISDLLSGNVGNLFFIYCSSVNMLTTLCYILIWGIIRCKKQGKFSGNLRTSVSVSLKT